ncbi:MAG: EAL domain-containing protein [Motilibacteraceae bacterium]
MDSVTSTGGDDQTLAAAFAKVFTGPAEDGSPSPRLVAQPIIDVAGARVAGYELLSRFAGPPVSPPDTWFAAAREHGHEVALSVDVLAQAIALRADLAPDRFITVNLEPDLLLEPAVQSVLLDGGSLARIVVELTEHTRSGDERALVAVLDRLRSAGALVAIDDAGTGYAGLSALLALRPDIVKLDRELVAGIHHDPVRRALVEMLGSLLGRMDCWLLAEGVEEQGELEVLAELQVPLAQGWLLGRPAAPFAELADDVHRLLVTTTARSLLVDHVAPLVHGCEVVRVGGIPLPGQVSLAADGAADAVGLLDVGGHHALAPAMTVAPSTSVVDAAHRAMSRPAQHRHVPLVCTDPRGTVLGLVEVADLVTALTAAPHPADPVG